MSWNRIEYNEKAACACGEGYIIRHMYRDEDDWNRIRGGCKGIDIDCPECKAKYHIQTITRHFVQYSWDGDGISETVYLVPNGVTIPSTVEERCFSFSDFKENAVSTFTENQLREAYQDMLENKYSTRLQNDVSKKLVEKYYKRYKKKNLQSICVEIEEAIRNYHRYEWTPERILDYKNAEKERIKKNREEIEAARSLSFKLIFAEE